MQHTWQAYTPEDTTMEQHFKENEDQIMAWGIHRNDIEV